MNCTTLIRLFTILTIVVVLLSCSKNSDKNSDTEIQGAKNEDGEANRSDRAPEEILAIIQEGNDPPSGELVQRFGELLKTLKGYYSKMPANEMADKLTMAYHLANDERNTESIFQFIEGFMIGVNNAVKYDKLYDFTLFLGNYVCYKTTCSTDKEITKFFSLEYQPPLTKAGHDGDQFILLDNIETFRQRFNSFAKATTSSLRIQQVDIHDGDSNNPGRAFEYVFSTNFYIVGSLNKYDNSIRNITVALEGNRPVNEVVNFLVAIGGIIASTNPNLTPIARGEILKEVGITEIQNINPSEPWTRKCVRNGVAYNFSAIPEQGILFNAENSEN